MKTKKPLILAAVLVPVIVLGLLIFGTNWGLADGWFKILISDPIPKSVSRLEYGSTGGFKPVRCFSFDISPLDLEGLMRSHSFERTDEEKEKIRLTHAFSQFPKIPLADLKGYQAFSARDNVKNISRLFLISPEKNHVYCVIET